MIGGAAIARRYARALFGLGEELGDPAALLAELEVFTDTVDGSEDLSRVMFTPIHPRAERRAVVAEIAEKLDLGRELRAFVMILVDANRAKLLPDVRQSFRQLVEEAAGRVAGEIVSARPLGEAELERIREALSRRVGAEVRLETSVDPELIGGVVAKVGDLLFDGSVRTQLGALGESLRKGTA
jgi:F-type H+-transporting ATPase subunit delta